MQKFELEFVESFCEFKMWFTSTFVWMKCVKINKRGNYLMLQIEDGMFAFLDKSKSSCLRFNCCQNVCMLFKCLQSLSIKHSKCLIGGFETMKLVCEGLSSSHWMVSLICVASNGILTLSDYFLSDYTTIWISCLGFLIYI